MIGRPPAPLQGGGWKGGGVELMMHREVCSGASVVTAMRWLDDDHFFLGGGGGGSGGEG